MFKSPVQLPEPARATVAATLNARLVDALDLYSHLKLAHWNVKGPHFATLHPLFESLADELNGAADTIAERAVTLGALAVGTAQQVATCSMLPEYPAATTRGLEHVRLLADRYDVLLEGLRTSRSVADEMDDADTSDLLTAAISGFEKNAWFLRATLEG